MGSIGNKRAFASNNDVSTARTRCPLCDGNFFLLWLLLALYDSTAGKG